MSKHLEIGKKGEQLAYEYLLSKNYNILEKNYRHKRGEIDLIAMIRGLLVFVEVKTRSKTLYGMPEEFVDASKEELIIKTADHYISQNDWQGDIRFDIISVELSKKKALIEHFEDAFH